MTPTISYQSEWAAAFRGEREMRIVTCECGTKRMDLGGPHAPLWRDGVLRDCMGRVVPHEGNEVRR